MNTVGTAAAFSRLLPRDRLIDAERDGTTAELDNAPTLRLAAAEIVREGYLLHFGEPRWYVFADRDLALLAGDRMYAAGLAALADDGDTEAVAVLARLIADCADAHATGNSKATGRLWDEAVAMLARGLAS